KSF
ncbi:phage tail fiber, partial [Escherichia coli PA4]